MRPSSSQVFNPPIEPVISSGENAAYVAMIDSQLVVSQDVLSLQSTSVVVIGAGLAGLAAARELKKSGVNVTILEASSRAGGRCQTLAFDEGVFAEAGGMRFPDSHKLIMKYIDLFGLDTTSFSNMKDKSGILFFDGVVRKIDQELQDPTSTLARVVEKWEQSISPIRSAYNSGSIRWNDLHAKYQKSSLLDFLREEEWSNELIEGFKKYGVGLGAYEAILELSFVEILRLFIVNNYEGKNLQIEGGMESLVHSFLFDNEIPLNSVIQYDYRVASIAQDSNGRYVVTSHQGLDSPTHECDYVVVTVPLPQLRSISFDPPLNDELKNAMNDVHYVQAAKIFLQTKSRFWLRHGVDGMMISDLNIQNTYFSPAFPTSSKGIITGSYVWEHQAEKLFALSEEEKVSLAVDEIKKVFPEIEQEFERGAAVEWKKGFCIFRPGQAHQYHKILRDEALPGIFLAGEHCSVEHGYFEGALESGLRAATSVLCSIDRDFHTRFESITGVFAQTSTGQKTGRKDKIQQHPADASQEALSFGGEVRPSSISKTILDRSKLPIIAKRLDHYTLICSNAKEVAEFHIKALRFELDSIKPINTGTVPEGRHDMLNYILRPPADKDMLMVVTEGLNDDTIFRKYMKAHGPGVHHFAFEVDNIDSIFAAAKKAGIQTTSEKVTMDIISGLKQFFIAPCHAGFFIELIERPRAPVKNDTQTKSDDDRQEIFTSNNMAELAQSISKFVKSEDIRNRLGYNCDEEEKKQDCATEHDIFDAIRGVDVGKIAAVEIAVENVYSSASFLIEILNFRFIRSTGKKIFIGFPGASQGVNIILKQAGSTMEERKTTIMFNAPNLTQRKMSMMSKAHFAVVNDAGIGGVLLPDQHTTYKVFLATPMAISMQTQIVSSYPSVFELHVDIKANMVDLVAFLADPVNLSSWTGHRALRYSQKRKCWLETRMDSSYTLTDFVVRVNVEESSRVCFSWPERGIKITFNCAEQAPGYCSTSVCLPSTLGEKTLADMKRIISIELDLLKSILERNTRDVIPDRIHQQILAHHLGIYCVKVKGKLPDHAAKEFGFRGEFVTSGTLFEQMSTDFGLTVKSQPQAILLPKDIADVQASIQMAKAYNIALAARGSRVSHSAGGQAQADGGLLIDMSLFSFTEFSYYGSSPSVKVGAGTFWDEVIRQSLCHGFMPPVINDYQYLSVGGTISMGGVGFMSHRYGIQAAYVDEMEIVTGEGSLLTCSKDENRDLFDYTRGGLGQCGIITSVTIPLVKAPLKIRTYKLFYPVADALSFLDDVRSCVESGEIELIHAFLKPCTKDAIGSIVGHDEFAGSSSAFKTMVEEGELNKSLVFFLELGCYAWNDYDQGTYSLDAVKHLLSPKQMCTGNYFTKEYDFQTYITRDPPVVKTNKAHGAVPHPSYATLIDEKYVLTLLDHHIGSGERGDDSTNEILIIPVKSNSKVCSGHDVRMFPMPKDSELSFFILFLGSVIPRSGETSQNIMAKIRAHHRSLHVFSNTLGGKRYSYDTITSEVKGENAWKQHFGEETWSGLVAAKRKFDPNHILCPGIPMWSKDTASDDVKSIG